MKLLYLQRRHMGYRIEKRNNMAHGVLLFVLGLIVGGALVYILSNSNAISYISLLRPSGNASIDNTQLASCSSQVNAQIDLLKSKLPSNAEISIINVTVFGASSKQTINEITTWVDLWQVGSSPTDCGWSGEGYLCSDIRTIQNQNMSAIGEAMKIQDYGQMGNLVSTVWPVLCGNGNLLPKSIRAIAYNPLAQIL